VLRHEPGRVGITLDESGWTDVIELLDAFSRHGTPITRAELEQVVRGSDKQRFAFGEDGTLIRANQGHSVNVDLGHVTSEPPPVLYHGTVAKFLGVIRAEGLRKGQRHHVHLSATLETAVRVGQRRGRALVLEVAAQAMARDGHRFFVSPNGVWLVEHVPPSYLAFPPEE